MRHDPRDQPNQPLWPERFGPEEVIRIKAEHGSYAWAGQYQQRPAPAEGGVIKRAWIKHYVQLPLRFDWKLQSWDCTFKDTSKSDFVAGHVWGAVGGQQFLIDRVHARLDMPATMTAIRQMREKHPDCHEILIEDKANGPAVISMLQAEIPGIIPIDPQGGKESRMRAWSPLVEAGNIFVPHPDLQPWVEEVMHEWCSFPNAVHDDDCDAATQAGLRLKGRAGGWLAWAQKQTKGEAPKVESPSQPQQTSFAAKSDGPLSDVCGARDGNFVCSQRPHGVNVPHQHKEDGRVVRSWTDTKQAPALRR